MPNINDIHLHLVLVHVSIVLFPIAVLIISWGLFGGSKDIKRVGLLLLIIAALNVVPAFETGEDSEEKVEHIKGVKESAIENHEEAAELVRPVALAAGVLALLTLFAVQTGGSWEKRSLQSTLLVSLVACGMLAWTGYQGGMIRHPEAYPELPQPERKPKKPKKPAMPPTDSVAADSAAATNLSGSESSAPATSSDQPNP